MRVRTNLLLVCSFQVIASSAAAGTIEDLCASPDAPAFCATFEQLTPEQKLRFLRDLSPRHQRQMGRDLGMALNGAGRAIGQRLQGLRLQMRQPGLRVAPVGTTLSLHEKERGGSAGEGLTDARWGAFLMGLSESAGQDADTDQLGYDSRRQQYTAGVDYRLTDTGVAGLAVSLGGSDADLDGNRIHQEGENEVVTLFGSHFLGDAWYVDGYALSGSADYETSRKVMLGAQAPVVESDASGSSRGAGLSTGVDLQRGGWGYGGYARLDYSRIKVGRYAETGPNGLGLLIDPQDIDNTQVTLGVQANRALSTSVGVWIPQANLEWVHDGNDGVRTVTGQIRGPNGAAPLSYLTPGQDVTYGSAAVSVTGTFAHGWSGFVRASTLFARDDGYDSETVELGTRAEF
jgi:uncharacterized protein YhjY with autotransporter beta-barrel domain